MRKRRYWESASDSQLRSASGVILGALFALIPPLSGRLDLEPFLVSSLIGALAVFPFWRQAGGSLQPLRSRVGFLVFILGILVVGGLFSAIAIWTYLGAWVCNLGAIRFLNRWRY